MIMLHTIDNNGFQVCIHVFYISSYPLVVHADYDVFFYLALLDCYFVVYYGLSSFLQECTSIC